MDFNNPSSQTIMLPFSIFGFLLLLYVLSMISRSRRNKHDGTSKAPPEASGAWPFIGHLHLLGGSQPPHVTLGKMADKYGPVFSIRIGLYRTLVVSSWEMAKECFTVNDKVFANRPKSVAFEVMGYNYAMMGFSPYGSYWHNVRKMAILELLSHHRLEMLKHVRESEVKAAMKGAYDFWLKTNKSGSEKAVTEMKKWFGAISSNIVLRMVAGKRFVAGSDSENEANERTQKALRDLFDLSGAFLIADAMPYLRWLDLGGQEKAMKKTAKELDQVVQVWLEEHKRNRACGSEKVKGKQDYMDVLLSIVDDAVELDGHDAETTIKANCLALVLAGTDTTTGTLTWALSLMLNNREVLNKAVEELDTQIGRDRLVVETDLNKLVYIEAILKETMRLYPPAPLNLPHESMEDCTVGGYHVPAGTRLLTNISKIHRDPRVYPDPLEFRPERFLTTHKGVDLRGNNFELIPFGAGRRMCPGVSLALQVMPLMLANLLHGFHIVTPENQPVDMREQTGLTNIKASPLQVLLTPRVSAQVYA